MIVKMMRLERSHPARSGRHDALLLSFRFGRRRPRAIGQRAERARSKSNARLQNGGGESASSRRERERIIKDKPTRYKQGRCDAIEGVLGCNGIPSWTHPRVKGVAVCVVDASGVRDVIITRRAAKSGSKERKL